MAMNETDFHFNETEHCAEFTDEDDATIGFWNFWLEGVSQVIISLFGLFGNILSIYILTR